ncbi:MAG: RnfABCDGE type electron transport complex subunit D [Treponema sp.]|nr:RnfABCDGE type electron transport complex subunit D [Treponema sp.]
MNIFNRFYDRKTMTLVRPFVYKNSFVGSEAKKIIVLLLIQVFFLLYSSSYDSVFVILSAVCASVAANLVSVHFFEDKFHNHYSWYLSIVQGLIVGFLLPSGYPVISVFSITLCTMLTIKHFFGGFSYAWVNPSVFAVVILWIVGARAFPEIAISNDLLLMRNPSLQLLETGYFKIYSFDQAVTESFNNSVFNLFGVTIPEGYISLFWDSGSAIPAFRFSFLTLVSSIILFSDDYIKLIIPSLFLVVYGTLVRFLTPVFFGGIFASGDILLALLSGGTLFTAVFVLNWYGTAPVSIAGKAFYGIIAGVFAFFISGCGTSACGMVFTVLLSNIVSILIQQWENHRNRLKLKKIMALVNDERGAK